MSDYLPPELIREILVRLPVRDLLRFRCVSKPWGTLIDSKSFTKAHLDHAVRTRSNRTLLVTRIELHSVEASSNRTVTVISNKIYYLDLNSFDRLDIGSTKLKFSCFSGSCNGLLLLMADFNALVLWNPATRKLNKLATALFPFQEMISHNYYPDHFALGYESKEDDYKIVRVLQGSDFVDGGAFTSKASIYSLKSNKWKLISGFPYMLHPRKVWGNCTNDALHIVVKDEREPNEPARIMAFHVGKEEHYEVAKPELAGSLQHVAVMNGCLTAIFTGFNSTNIWIMKEYRVNESWCKLLCFEPPISKLIPLAYSKSGDEVLLNYNGLRLNWYDLRTKKVTIASVDGLSVSVDDEPPGFDSFACVASLVSPLSPAAW